MQTTGLLSFNTKDGIDYFSKKTNVVDCFPRIIIRSSIMKTEITLVGISGKIIETVESITFILRTFYVRVSNVITKISVYFLSSITLAITIP